MSLLPVFRILGDSEVSRGRLISENMASKFQPPDTNCFSDFRLSIIQNFVADFGSAVDIVNFTQHAGVATIQGLLFSLRK